ncbi:MAG: histidine phosphatase family protein [Acidimicrobiia bacterium]|nr:histidine phosphatase family protein [Acidimicrobiia bacterium]
MARLLLLRHAPTAETGTVLTGRTAGVPLHEEGAAIAGAVAERLAGTEVRAVYTSPVLRCRQTAQAVADVHGLDPIRVRGLEEVDYGSWAGRRLKDLARLKRWEELFVAPSRVRFPDGETLKEVQDRAVAAVEAIAADHPKDTVVLVSHGDVIKAILAHYLGSPLDLFQRLHVSTASVSVIDVPTKGAPAVHAVNRILHGTS